MNHDRPVIVGIAGASGSGKSKLTSAILNGFDENDSENVRVIQEDSYYKDQSHLVFAEREQTNYDHPNAFEHDLLVSQVSAFSKGENVNVPVYDYSIHNRCEHTIQLTPAKLLLIEGILIFHDARLRELMDIKIFIDVPLDICLTRRIKRDLAERGRDVESILNQFEQTVRKMYFEFVEPTKLFADVIVPHGGENRVATQLIHSHLSKLLNSSTG